tara:strand:+ start:301 stop:543 length:243 start_codon:yes stop_codon:yes gene_type:complete
MKICFSGTMDIRKNHNSLYDVLVSYTCKNLFKTPITWKANDLNIQQIESLILRQPNPKAQVLSLEYCTKQNIKRKIDEIS